MPVEFNRQQSAGVWERFLKKPLDMCIINIATSMYLVLAVGINVCLNYSYSIPTGNLRTLSKGLSKSIKEEKNMNHGMFEVRRDLQSSSPTTLLKQSNLQPLSQDHAQTAFEYLHGGRLHNFSGQPVLGLSHRHSKKALHGVQTDPPVLQFVTIDTPLKRGWLFSSHPP